jgi:hypothetical protein
VLCAVLCYWVPHTPLPALRSNGNAAAVWDIWRREDAPGLQGWLVAHQGEFVHQEKRVADSTQPLLDQVTVCACVWCVVCYLGFGVWVGVGGWVEEGNGRSGWGLMKGTEGQGSEAHGVVHACQIRPVIQDPAKGSGLYSVRTGVARHLIVCLTQFPNHPHTLPLLDVPFYHPRAPPSSPFQVCMLQEAHRAELLADTHVQGWHFEQHEGEVVFIPAGCPHQVRNLRACTKVRQPLEGPIGRDDEGGSGKGGACTPVCLLNAWHTVCVCALTMHSMSSLYAPDQKGHSSPAAQAPWPFSLMPGC